MILYFLTNIRMFSSLISFVKAHPRGFVLSVLWVVVVFLLAADLAERGIVLTPTTPIL
jgi:hypothetical protein